MSEESSSKPPFPEKYESSINIKKGSGEEPAAPRPAATVLLFRVENLMRKMALINLIHFVMVSPTKWLPRS